MSTINASWIWPFLIAIIASLMGFYVLTYDYKKNLGKHNRREDNYMIPSTEYHMNQCTDIDIINKCDLQCKEEKQEEERIRMKNDVVEFDNYSKK